MATNRTTKRRLPRVARRELTKLQREVERYLATVDAFRAEGCEPQWRAV